jgi:Na+-driven multidrug efflux pump
MYASDLAWPLLYGIADSLAPAIGYNWGAQNYGRVKKIVKCAYTGTATIGLISTAVLFFFSGGVASLFASAEDAMLLEVSAHAIRLFCFAYLFRWMAVTTQSFLSAIEKPALATIMSVAVAFVFPVLILGAAWNMGLDGIWLNFVGVNFCATILAIILLTIISREIKKKEALVKGNATAEL